MSRKSIPLLCYWDGRIFHGSQGITYEGAIPRTFKVDRGIQFSDLFDKIYELIGIDFVTCKLKIICRDLANGQYVVLAIDNDESLDIMLDMTKEKGINCVELYIEKSFVSGLKSIPLLCYYDGRVSHDSQGITFEDVMPKATAVNRGIKYSDLVDKFYESIGIKPEQYKLMIICRYLANGKYIALPIHDDESVDIMLDMTKVKGINCVEVNIQKWYVFRGSQSGKGEKPSATGDPSMHLTLVVLGQDGTKVFFRMKRETPLRNLMKAYCDRKQMRYEECAFYFAARRLKDALTPENYNMKDGDEIDAMVHQRGD